MTEPNTGHTGIPAEVIILQYLNTKNVYLEKQQQSNQNKQPRIEVSHSFGLCFLEKPYNRSGNVNEWTS